jgi:hypothetical protein
MERTSTFFGIIAVIVQNSLRWIIQFGRKYQIIPAAYLVVFFVSIIGYANQPATPPPPTPAPEVPSTPPIPATQNPVSELNPTPALSPPPPPAIEVASAKAYKNGNSITIRFDKPVTEVRILVGGTLLAPTCELQICTATMQEEVLQVQVSWYQGTESFSTNFRL